MKKAVLLLTCVFLVGCSVPASSEVDNVQPQEESEEFEDVENEYTDIEPELALINFGISSSDISKSIYGDNISGYSVAIDDYIVDVYPHDNYILYCAKMENEDYPMLIYMYDQEHLGTYEYSQNLIDLFLQNNSLDNISSIKTQAVKLDKQKLIYCAWIKASNAVDFPLSVAYLPDNDYFFTVNQEEYKSLYEQGNYDKIYDNVTKYIDDNTPELYDSAYTIQKILEPIIDNWDSLTIYYDEVDKYSTFYDSAVTSLGNDIHFVPYATSRDKNINAIVGFYNTDWLFFDNITITSTDNIKVNASDYSKIEDVCDNGNILESYRYEIYDDDLQNLLAEQEHIIRFSNTREQKNIDYDMTQAEFDALSKISSFQNVRNILSDLLFRFNLRADEQ